VTDEAPAGKPRSRKLYVLWAIALTLLLALGLFSWLVVVPVWQVRSGLKNVGWYASGPVDSIPGGRELVSELGGPRAATSKLMLYLRMPDFVAPGKALAIDVLRVVGPDAAEAIPVLEWFAANGKDVNVRSAADTTLWCLTAQPTPAFDGRYAVLPWDTFPEFGKSKQVTFAEMVLKDGRGAITIWYQDQSEVRVEVTVLAAYDEVHFLYALPGRMPRGHFRSVDLRRAGDFLEIDYVHEWVRFAKRLKDGERMAYPGWGSRAEEVWGKALQKIKAAQEKK